MTTLEKLALIFEEKFIGFGTGGKDVDFMVAGSRTIDVKNFPLVTIQQLEDNTTDFKRRVGNDRYRTERTTFQFNFMTKVMLDDIKFMKKFTAFLLREFKFATYQDKGVTNFNDVEFVSYSAVRDATEGVAGEVIYVKSIDVTFNYFEKYTVIEVPINTVKGVVQERSLLDNYSENLIYEQEVKNIKE